jgi:biopolymer transport protein TolQ
METLALAQEIDFSLWALFLRATFTVKVVMIMLIVASFWSWAIIVQKHLDLRRARGEAREFEETFWSGEPLDAVYDRVSGDPDGVGAGLRRGHDRMAPLAAGDGGMIPGAQSRIDRAMNVAIERESEGLNKGLTFLASVGATAPFIGLFGTVWGIKHAFEEIALQQSTNLAVVAPGIAEALLATGLGLLAAIPAVIFYNKLNQEASRSRGATRASPTSSRSSCRASSTRRLTWAGR